MYSHPAEGTAITAAAEEVGDVLLEDVDHGLLPVAYGLQSLIDALDRVLAASIISRRISTKALKRTALS